MKKSIDPYSRLFIFLRVHDAWIYHTIYVLNLPLDMSRFRCFGNKPGQEFYAHYHDFEWGVPVHNDTRLFEMLILEGAQAGLSWETILKKRVGYRRAFHNFDVRKVSEMCDVALEKLRQDKGIIRNRLKIYAARKNASVFLEIQQLFGSFDTYVWSFVGGNPIVNAWETPQDVPVTTKESDAYLKIYKSVA